MAPFLGVIPRPFRAQHKQATFLLLLPKTTFLMTSFGRIEEKWRRKISRICRASKSPSSEKKHACTFVRALSEIGSPGLGGGLRVPAPPRPSAADRAADALKADFAA